MLSVKIASRSARQIHYVVYARDYTDNGKLKSHLYKDALQRRMQCRQNHLDRAKKAHSEKRLLLGGALIENKEMIGSK